MKLQEAPNAICKVVKFPGSVTSYLRSEGVTNERYVLKGGLLKGKTQSICYFNGFCLMMGCIYLTQDINAVTVVGTRPCILPTSLALCHGN